MCGFLYINDKFNPIDLKKSHDSLNLQQHRGPDFQGEVGLEFSKNQYNFLNVKEKKNQLINYYLGHNRLKIIDLSEKSNQPIFKNQSFFLYNGEFYNYQNFDKEKTNSDTLTLFNRFKESGVSFLNEVNGMWSLVYGDLKNNKIFLSRDRYGKKPLYYYKNENLFIASSEIKSIFNYLDKKSREINPEYLARFFVTKLNDYSSEKTFYKEIKSVKAGEVLELNNLNLELKKVLNIKKFPLKNFNTKSRKEIGDNLKIDLQNAVSSRLISDAPVGVLVSGGMDSSAIVSNIINLKKKDNVNFFFAKQFISAKNELSDDDYYVKIISKALKIKINEIELVNESSKIEKIFFDLTHQFEEPFNIELASIPTYLISKNMKEKGIKVSIDGIAGDEILSGYPSFLSLANANLHKNNYINFLKYFRFYLNHSPHGKKSDLLTFLSQIKNKLFVKKKIKDNKIFSNKFNDYVANIDIINLRAQYSTATKRQLLELFKFQIPYYLKIADQCNMINSVENRSPFLDLNLFKYVFLKEEFKFDKNFTKTLLREILRNELPNEIVYRKKKGGFGSSMDINKLKTKKNIEMILDCKISRSILAKDINIEKLLNDKSLFKNFLVLSYLSTQYNLNLNI